MCHGISYNKNLISNNNLTNLSKKYIKYCILLLIFAVFLVFGAVFSKSNIAYAEDGNNDLELELESEVDNILSDTDFTDIELVLSDYSENYLDYLNASSFKDFLVGIINGENELSFSNLFGLVKLSLLDIVKDLLSPLLLIFAIVCLCNLLNSINSGRLDKSISDIIYFLCLSVIVIIVSLLVKNVIDLSVDTIEKLQSQINAIFPILLSLMTAIGATSSVTVYSPILSTLSTTFVNVFTNILLPLFTCILLLIIVSKLTKNNRLGKINGFFSSVFKWILGTTCTIFVTFLSFQGLTASTKDGLSIKAAKFAIKNYIPMLGGYISDGFELIKAGSVLVKNALGFASIFLVFFTLIKPLAYLCILSLGLKLISGASELIDNIKINSLLYDIASALKMLVAIVVGVACMYFFVLFLCVCTGNTIL